MRSAYPAVREESTAKAASAGQAGGWGASLGAPRERERGTRSRGLVQHQHPDSQPDPGCLSWCRQSTRSSRPCFLSSLQAVHSLIPRFIRASPGPCKRKHCPIRLPHPCTEGTALLFPNASASEGVNYCTKQGKPSGCARDRLSGMK